MNTIKKFKLELLTNKSVNVIIDTFIVDDKGKEYKIGDTYSMGYYNSLDDRQKLQTILPEDFYNAIMAVWGKEVQVADFEQGVKQ